MAMSKEAPRSGISRLRFMLLIYTKRKRLSVRNLTERQLLKKYPDFPLKGMRGPVLTGPALFKAAVWRFQQRSSLFMMMSSRQSRSSTDSLPRSVVIQPALRQSPRMAAAVCRAIPAEAAREL